MIEKPGKSANIKGVTDYNEGDNVSYMSSSVPLI